MQKKPMLWALATMMLSIIPLAMSQELPQTDQQKEDRTSCLKNLHLMESDLTIGTHQYRLEACMQDRIRNREDRSRAWRLELRTQKVQERMKRNSRAIIYTRGELFQKSQNIHQLTDEEKLRARTSAITQYRFFARPSLRTIRADAVTSATARVRSAALRAQRIEAARNSCVHFHSQFERTNCIRSTLRRIGSE